MELYHVTNRGVDGRNIFMDSQDYARFVHDLYEFNDTAPALPFDHAVSRRSNVRRRTSYIRARLVDIHAWALMKNHYHLLLTALVEDGITIFLRKLSGYARYFNDRHGRRGSLLQGRSKKILVTQQKHFLYVPHYIHLNPLDYLPGSTQWRERDKGPVTSADDALAYLRTYRWSSYLDFCGQKNFPSVITKGLFADAYGTSYEAAVKEYLEDRASSGVFSDISLDFEM